MGRAEVAASGDETVHRGRPRRVRYPRGRALPAMTSRSITSVPRLRARLAEVRELGVAYDDCESNDAVHCVAAPVHDHTDAMVAP